MPLSVFIVTGDSKWIKSSLLLRGCLVWRGLKACLVQRVLFYSSLFIYFFHAGNQAQCYQFLPLLRLWFYFHFAGSHHWWPAVWNYLLCHRGSLHHEGGWSSKQGQSHHHNWCRSEAVFSGLSWRKHGALYEYLFTGNTGIISMALNWCLYIPFLTKTVRRKQFVTSIYVFLHCWDYFFLTIKNVKSTL